jgi:hypothetical protein
MFTQLFWNCWVFTCFLDYFIFFSFSSFLELLSISLSYFFRSKKMRSICVFLATVVTSVFCLYLTAKYIYSVDLGLQRNSIKLDQPVSSNISQTGMQSNLCERPPLNNDHLSGSQTKYGQTFYNTNFVWKPYKDQPSQYNGHFFQVPRVALVDRFDCTLKT